MYMFKIIPTEVEGETKFTVQTLINGVLQFVGIYPNRQDARANVLDTAKFLPSDQVHIQEQ